MEAGADNDRVNGGGGDNVLLGGSGNDTLTGRLGRDLLIGGADADTLTGSAGDDILMAGMTYFDSDLSTLDAIMAEWTSARTYAERVANLQGTGLNVSGPDVVVFDDWSAPSVPECCRPSGPEAACLARTPAARHPAGRVALQGTGPPTSASTCPSTSLSPPGHGCDQSGNGAGPL